MEETTSSALSCLFCETFEKRSGNAFDSWCGYGNIPYGGCKEHQLIVNIELWKRGEVMGETDGMKAKKGGSKYVCCQPFPKNF